MKINTKELERRVKAFFRGLPTPRRQGDAPAERDFLATCGNHEHPDAETIFRRARKRIPLSPCTSSDTPFVRRRRAHLACGWIGERTRWMLIMPPSPFRVHRVWFMGDVYDEEWNPCSPRVIRRPWARCILFSGVERPLNTCRGKSPARDDQDLRSL